MATFFPDYIMILTLEGKLFLHS